MAESSLENLEEALELFFEDQVETAAFENPVVITFQLSASVPPSELLSA